MFSKPKDNKCKIKSALNMARGHFNIHTIIDAVLEGERHHEGEQAQVPRKCRRLASSFGKTLL